MEIRRFKEDPLCRLFLSSDAGSLGLNLQMASVVINLDLPWNPARLEQRIARAWRKHQTSPVRVINLVTEKSIEHRMLGVLAAKQELADGVLDGLGDLSALQMPSGRAALVERLDAMIGQENGAPLTILSPEEALANDLKTRHGERLRLRRNAGRPHDCGSRRRCGSDRRRTRAARPTGTGRRSPCRGDRQLDLGDDATLGGSRHLTLRGRRGARRPSGPCIRRLRPRFCALRSEIGDAYARSLAASASPRMRFGVDQVAMPVPAKSRSVVQTSASTLQASAKTWASLIDPFRLGTASLSAVSHCRQS